MNDPNPAPAARSPGLIESVRSAPVTWALAASWVGIFAAMAARQGGLDVGGNLLTSGISPATSHPFGDLTTAELLHGELWRALTATFIHYSLPHLFFNLMGLYQLGRLLESWYGSAQLLGLYVATGLLGNLLAGFSKPLVAQMLRPWVTIPVAGASGGGSGVLCGAIAMLAVVGWRSRSRYGDYLRRQMVGVLVFTAVLGVIIPHIDNFGHAGGAIVGGLIGFLDPAMLQMAKRRQPRRMIGVAALAVILACFGLQYRSAQVEATAIRIVPRMLEAGLLGRARAIVQINRLAFFYREISLWDESRPPALLPIGRPARREAIASGLARTVADLDATRSGLESGATATDYRMMLDLARRASARRPTPGEIVQFDRAAGRVFVRAQQEQIAARALLDRLRAPRPRPNAARPAP